MVTIFSTPKPFTEHIEVIQRNAIESWLRLDAGVEVILFGDEAGAAETVREFNLRHEREVRRNAHGTKYLAPIFDRAREIARHDLLCYVNCDIILLRDFGEALRRVRERFERFLMIGRRWDTDIRERIDFSEANWDATVRARALQANHQRLPQWIDFFVFSRDIYYKQIPGFVVGRPGWDNWLVWHARSAGAEVVDVSQVVVAVHQNHDYSYHPEGERGVWEGEEARQNYALLRNGQCFRTIENATQRLTADGFEKNYRHYLTQAKRRAGAGVRAAWFNVLDVTRPIRRRLGLRAGARAAAPLQK